MDLYHFSEEPGIRKFVPREKQNMEGMSPVVWAIDQEHEVSYYFPRDCPRIILRKSDAASDTETGHWFVGTTATAIITVESRWYNAINNTTLYRYVFSDHSFERFDPTAGYYTSSNTIEPIRVDVIDNLVARILSTGAELRFTDSLHPLKDAVLASGFQDFGIHRFANAIPWRGE